MALNDLRTHVDAFSHEFALIHQLLEPWTVTPKIQPAIYPNGPSASPLSDPGIENLAVRDFLCAEEALRLLSATDHFDGSLLQRILTATAKECNPDPLGVTTFLDRLGDREDWPIAELAKEWAMDAIKLDVGEEMRGFWWITSQLICTDFLAIEDVLSRVIHVLPPLSDGMVQSRWFSLIEKALAEPQVLILLSQMCSLFCADNGTQLHIPMAVPSF
jgi:hypothetical protein